MSNAGGTLTAADTDRKWNGSNYLNTEQKNASQYVNTEKSKKYSDSILG